MPTVDYSKTIIYQIRFLGDEDFCYVGHTTNFRSRKNQHKSFSKKSNLAIYVKIRENGGWEKFEMIPLEEYTNCKSLIEARIREQEWIEKLKAKLNSIRAYGKDYEKKKGHNTHYRQEYAEQIKEKKELNDLIFLQKYEYLLKKLI